MGNRYGRAQADSVGDSAAGTRAHGGATRYGDMEQQEMNCDCGEFTECPHRGLRLVLAKCAAEWKETDIPIWKLVHDMLTSLNTRFVDEIPSWDWQEYDKKMEPLWAAIESATK